jgi:hypothetical protein
LLESLINPPLPVPVASAQKTKFAIEINMINDLIDYHILPRIVLYGEFLSELSKKEIAAVKTFNSKIGFTKPIGEAEFKKLLYEVSCYFANFRALKVRLT